MIFESFNNWLLEQESNEAQKQTYGCIMIEGNIPNWEEYHLDGINKDDVFIKPNDDSYGLETQPHITIVYGIHEDEIDPEVVCSVIEKNMKPLKFTITNVDIFENKEYDVVKYNVPVTPKLKEYRNIFLQFPNTQMFPEYNPHITIAYVLPGMGKKYKRELREPFDVIFDKGVYSWHEPGEEELKRRVINLNKKKNKIKLY